MKLELGATQAPLEQKRRQSILVERHAEHFVARALEILRGSRSETMVFCLVVSNRNLRFTRQTTGVTS